MRRAAGVWIACWAALAFEAAARGAPGAGPQTAPAEPSDPIKWDSLRRPGQHQFVLDLAEMISPDDERRIRAICDDLLTRRATPIIVVTIRSMTHHGAKGMRIERFAHLLFDHWGIGAAKRGRRPWNRGILLLVSKGDRKARIELGAGWGRRKDDPCRKTMDEEIIPLFKKSEFSAGITAGVRALAAMAGGAESQAPPPASEAFCYIPPTLAGRVLLYHAFENGAGEPEIDRLAGKIVADAKGECDGGLTGRGFQVSHAGKAKRGPELRGLALPLSRPITVSLWWRLDAPMKADSHFALLALRADKGYISNFVRGKGQWCALREPTFVVQVYRFEGISNVNGIRFGHAWVDHGVWHHAAVTVSAASQVSVYWDGRCRSTFPVKGRLFGRGDLVRTISFGGGWLAHPMTIDELLVLDRALSREEIAHYVTAVRKLREVGFPVRSPRSRRDAGDPGDGAETSLACPVLPPRVAGRLRVAPGLGRP